MRRSPTPRTAWPRPRPHPARRQLLLLDQVVLQVDDVAHLDPGRGLELEHRDHRPLSLSLLLPPKTPPFRLCRRYSTVRRPVISDSSFAVATSLAP